MHSSTAAARRKCVAPVVSVIRRSRWVTASVARLRRGDEELQTKASGRRCGTARLSIALKHRRSDLYLCQPVKRERHRGDGARGGPPAVATTSGRGQAFARLAASPEYRADDKARAASRHWHSGTRSAHNVRQRRNVPLATLVTCRLTAPDAAGRTFELRARREPRARTL
jgi:hypothetical protein